MNKLILFCGLLMTSLGAFAQSATFVHTMGTSGKDSSIKNVAGGLVEIHNPVKNISNSTLQAKWTIINSSFGTGWSLENVCDNLLCRDATIQGPDNPLNFGKSFDMLDIAPGDEGDMKVSFKGVNPPKNSLAFITIQETDKNTNYQLTNTFIVYNDATNVKNIIRNNEQISIYPNPLVGSTLNVIYNPSLGVKTIGVYNVIGKLLAVYKTSSNNSAKLNNLESLSSGVYFLRLMNSEGQVVATKRFTNQ